MVYASSSAVYGDAVSVPQVDDRLGNVLSPYAAAKKTNEFYAEEVFQRSYGLEAGGASILQRVWSPARSKRRVRRGQFHAGLNLLNGEPCNVYGDGETSRDFVHVANAIQANLLAATTHERRDWARSYNVAVVRKRR